MELAKFLRTPILKNIRKRLLLKSVLSAGLHFLITSGANWYLRFIFCVLIYRFVCKSPFTTIDTAIINQKQSTGGVLPKKISYKFGKIHKKTPALESRFSGNVFL